MAFITRCPSCGTAFKVVADQLKIADGWVRCGQCQQVFDATLDLQPAFPVPPVPSVTVAPPTPVPDPIPTPSTAAPVPDTMDGVAVASDTEREPAPPWDRPEPRMPAAASSPPSEQERAWPEPPVSEPTLSPPSGAAAASASAAAPMPPVSPGRGDAPLEPRWEDGAGAAPAASPSSPDTRATWPDEPTFVRQARRRAFWRRPLVRLALLLMALGLAAALAGQTVWHWRDALTARYPQTLPWVTAFCERAGCSLAPPRRPGEVVIEGSVLLRRAPDRYSFHLVVRNNASTEVVAPALELTLTDLQDQVLVRRVWMPDAWPQPTPVLAPQSEWPLQFELLFDHAQAARMTGYRAVLFYP